MRAEQFIKNYGFKKSWEVVIAAPELYTGTDKSILCYRLKDNKYSTRFNPSTEIVNISTLKHLLESYDILESLGGMGKALDMRYWEHKRYFDNSERIDRAIDDFRNWFNAGDVVVRKNYKDDNQLRTINDMVRDQTWCDCDDGYSHYVGDIQHATLAEIKIGHRIDEVDHA
ncbi:hypothetical protein QSV37_15105 [Acinetobacter sp. VNK23]|uniref:hypothetical protein n=1 Tax=Acinetobacter thutiue TaxID=2998078 RepID=UPI002578B00D|nr:hypothetical protein [Acinetobacter thutiue]MDM1021620.1 hypothetical protein [Acinetobacter thutiue]